MSHERPIAEELLTSLDPVRAQLIGSLCVECGHHAFPRQASCSRCCGTSVKPVKLARRGTLWSWTNQSFMPPSPPYSGPESSAETFSPFFLGMVELPGQCRVVGRLALHRKDIEIDMKLELDLFPFVNASDGSTLVSYIFKAVPEAPN